ncbi:hypothetical protein Tco_1343060 [Tanacetum coccineum]
MRSKVVADFDMSNSARGKEKIHLSLCLSFVLESFNVASFLDFFYVRPCREDICHNRREYQRFNLWPFGCISLDTWGNAYYSISPTKYTRQIHVWSADLKSNTKKTSSAYGKLHEVLVLYHYVLLEIYLIVNYDKFALWGVSHWGKKRRQFYAFAITRESARDVYSKRRIIAVTKSLEDDGGGSGVLATKIKREGEARLSIISIVYVIESQTEITINPLGTLVKFRLAKSLHCEFPRYILRVPTSLSLDFATTSEWILSIHNEDRNPARATIETAHVGDSAGNPVKGILLKLNLPDHSQRNMKESFPSLDIERLYRSDEVLKLRNFKKDATLKLSKSTNQEWVIGCLMYAMTCTRPDIAFAVGKVSKYTSNPSTQHWQAIQRVLKYLKKIMVYRLTYTGYSSALEEYTDASWISNTEDNSSTSGWIFLLGGGAISWASKKQTCITGSIIEFEFLALASASK